MWDMIEHHKRLARARLVKPELAMPKFQGVSWSVISHIPSVVFEIWLACIWLNVESSAHISYFI